jgi:sugar phosphate isomerase/epimerase
MSFATDRLGVVAAALSADVREAPRLARLAEFRGLLFDAWSSSLSIPDLSITGRREFRQLLSAQDQRLIGLQLALGPKGFALGADVDRQISRIDRAMESAAGLQSPLLCIDLSTLPRAKSPPRPKPAVTAEQAGLIIIPTMSAVEPAAPVETPGPDPAFVAQVNGALSELGVRADRYGVSVAFSSSLASFAALQEAIAQARCSWFGIDLDPVSILRDEWSIDEIFSSAGSLIRHVRGRDAVAGDDKRTQPAVVGKGSTNWRELLDALDDAGYSDFISIDPTELPERAAAAIAGAAFLRGLAR